jgi:hypothetical protein
MTGISRRTGRRRGLIVQERDLMALMQLWIMRVADRDQVMLAAGFHSITRVNARLLALTHAGLLRRFFIGSGGGRKALYALSAKGAQLIERPPRGLRRRQDELLIADFSVIHQLAINDLYCNVRFRPIPVPAVSCLNWMGFTEPLTEDLRLIPDGYVEWRTPQGIDAAFIEVDLGHENLAVWKEKAKRYLEFATSGIFPRKFSQPRFRVLVLANSSRRMRTVRTAVSEITQKIFWFASLSEAQGKEFFGSVWLRPVGETYQPLFGSRP